MSEELYASFRVTFTLDTVDPAAYPETSMTEGYASAGALLPGIASPVSLHHTSVEVLPLGCTSTS